MPTIEEVHDDGDSSNATNSNSARQEQNGHNSNDGTTGFNRIVNHMIANKIEAALWLTRLCTIFFALSVFIPFLGGLPASYYQKCLLSSCISSALRLHQRVPNFQFNGENFARLVLEDSAHYLLYSIIFVTCGQISMAILPLFLYAVLHAQSYSKQLLNVGSVSSSSLICRLLAKVESRQVDMLRFIACSEIFIMPTIVFALFSGQGSIISPFLYYKFLSLRYSSRRNPYCKQLFYELRVATEALCGRPQCPQMIRNLLHNAIHAIGRLAPAV